MLTEICKELNNWFDRGLPKYFDNLSIVDNVVMQDGKPIEIKNGQYFRIVGSIFNDGVHLKSSDLRLTSEDFDGAVWLMAVPKAVVDLAAKIGAWVDKYGGVNSANLSPYNSESFGGYSYSKSGGGSASGDNASAGTWQGAFSKELALWRKI